MGGVEPPGADRCSSELKCPAHRGSAQSPQPRPAGPAALIAEHAEAEMTHEIDQPRPPLAHDLMDANRPLALSEKS